MNELNPEMAKKDLLYRIEMNMEEAGTLLQVISALIKAPEIVKEYSESGQGRDGVTFRALISALETLAENHYEAADDLELYAKERLN